MEGEEEDVFEREWVAVIGVKFAAALGMADVNPVGRAVAGAMEAGVVDEGFEEQRPIAISILPVEGDLFGEASKDAGCEVL